MCRSAPSSYRLLFSYIFVFSCVVVCAAPSSAAVVTATWADTGNHSYNDSSNWGTLGAVPINNGTDEYIVNVLTGTVSYDVIAPDPGEVLQFKLEAGATLNIQGRNLQVNDSATIGGQLNVTSGSFVATHPSSSITGNQMTISVDTSATLLPANVTLGATGTYTTTHSSIQNATILSANGGGATLNLKYLTSIDSYIDYSYARNRTISATAGGAIDLSGITTLRGGGGNDRLLFSTTGGGTINLSNLQQITAGTVGFKTDTTTLNLNQLTDATGLSFELATAGTTVNMPLLNTQTSGSYYVQNGHIFNAGSLNTLTNAYVEVSDPTAQFNTGGLANIDNTQFILSNGSQLNNITATSYLTTGSAIQASTLMSADGAGTLLDASSLTSIDSYVDYSYARNRTISATAGGAINLSGITTLRGGGGDDRLLFSTTGGGTINLSNLQQITAGTVGFKTDTTTLNLNKLTDATGLSFELATAGTTVNMPLLNTQTSGSYYVQNGHVFNAGSLTTLTNAYVEVSDPTAQFNTGGLANIDNTRFILSNGSQLNNITATSYLTTSSAIQASTILSADGAGTLLDASSLTSIDSYVNYSYARDRTISATAGGAIDLSGITTLRGGGGDDRLLFSTTGGGTIDLSNLQQITAGTVGFKTDTTTLDLNQLTDATGLSFELATAGTTVNMPLLNTQTSGSYYVENGHVFNAGSLTTLTNAYVEVSDPTAQFNTGGLANIDNTRFALTNGAQLSEITATSYLTTSSAIQASTLMSADGAGTLLDASSLTSIDSYVDYSYARDRTISATAGGAIDLSGITTLRGGGGDDRLVFTATIGGTIDLSNFQQVTAGNVIFNASDGGSLAFGDLNVTNAVHFNIADANTEVSFGHLALAADANLAVTGGAMLTIGGDFSSELTDETFFDMDTGLMQFDGDEMQWLEVAGMDNGVSGVGTGNFGMAQLIVGSDTQATEVTLVDLFDNGNRGSATEALYLLGSGGLDGLQILGGSTLYIGDIPVYSLIGGQMTELHDLFGPGETVISYSNFGSDGYIALTVVPEPSTLALLLLGLGTLIFFWRKR